MGKSQDDAAWARIRGDREALMDQLRQMVVGILGREVGPGESIDDLMIEAVPLLEPEELAGLYQVLEDIAVRRSKGDPN